MENNKFSEIPKFDVAEGSETAIEIKIKTLDSQTYTLKVNKQVSVPALKEQIASVTGVLSEQQRLICRGKVLKDDQLLSAYHVEDGHTLHLVVRQPIPLSSDGAPSADDPSFGNRGLMGHLSPSVVIETFSVPDQGGEGVPREISRIVSAVLGSFGLSSFGSSAEGRPDRTSGATNASSNSNQPQSEPTRGPSERWPGAFGLPAAVSLGQPPVMPDSLVTMSHYLNHMRRDFNEMVHVIGNQAQAATMDSAEGRESNSAQNPNAAREGLPTPASLAVLMTSTRQMFVEQIANCLQTFTSELENQVNITDPSLRAQAQDRAMRIGMSILYLGAYILELGRTVMTLRLGQNPSEAVVNAGPAIYISSSGPNPLMVQPLPFQMGSSFGSIPIPTHQNPSFGGGLSTSYIPRRIDIQIRRGTSNATANTSSGAENRHQTPLLRTAAAANPGADNPLDPLTSGVRVVPIRTMMAAVPASFGHLPSDSTDPLLDPSVRVHATMGSQGGNENATSAGETQSYQEQGRQIPGSVYQLLQSLFPGGEIVVEEESFIGAGTGTDTGFVSQSEEMSASATAMDASAPEAADGGASSDGIFLSNLLHQIMPLISQHTTSGEEPHQDSSFQAGSSGFSEDPDSLPPSSKRQKKE